jgi:hypothetical protein
LRGTTLDWLSSMDNVVIGCHQQLEHKLYCHHHMEGARRVCTLRGPCHCLMGLGDWIGNYAQWVIEVVLTLYMSVGQTVTSC